MKGILIEGASAVGKTSIIRELRLELAQNHPYLTELYITEGYTYQMLDRRVGHGEMTEELIENHLSDIVSTLEPFHKMLAHSYFTKQPAQAGEAVVILERSALTHCAHENISPSPFERHFRELNELGIHLVVLWLAPEKLRQRLETALEERRGPNWLKHVESLGGPEKTLEFYLNFQQKILDDSKLVSQWIPTHYIETTGNPKNISHQLLEQLDLPIH